MKPMKAKILIVDDNRTLTSLLRSQLSLCGYACLVANDGESALALALSERPDLVILDIMMIGHSGLQVCRKLKATPQTEQAPVLIITAKGLDADRKAAFEAGASDFLPKPFRIHELESRVQALLSGRSPEAASAAGPSAVV